MGIEVMAQWLEMGNKKIKFSKFLMRNNTFIRIYTLYHIYFKILNLVLSLSTWSTCLIDSTKPKSLATLRTFKNVFTIQTTFEEGAYASQH